MISSVRWTGTNVEALCLWYTAEVAREAMSLAKEQGPATRLQ